MRPFILTCAVPRNGVVKSGPEVIYDARRQLTVLVDDPEGPPAFMHPRAETLVTKKGDREKGEDTKDKFSPVTRREL